MSNAALQTTQVQENQAKVYLAYSRTVTPVPLLSKRTHIQLIAAILVTLQILDGLLTYAGMYTFGIAAEGNPLLRGLMNNVGVLPAIAIIKLLCIATVLALCAQAQRISWLPVALTCVAGIYTVAAIIPWSWLLVSEYLV
jgi:hypothetical protein